MKAALLIQSIALPAILANLLTVDLVAPLQDYDGITVTGKNQSADDHPVMMSRIPCGHGIVRIDKPSSTSIALHSQ